MAPSPKELSTTQNEMGTKVADGEKIVISGMSGLYPASHHIKEFSENLYNKVNPVTSDGLRYRYNHPESTQVCGTIPDLETFDGQFFKINYVLSNSMDPMSRKVLEQAYQAIYDAGVSPEQLSGKKVGVYIGTCYSETEKIFFFDHSSTKGLGVVGCNKSMFANRISFWLNAKGPSMAIDEACCSSTAALEQAYLAMRRGDCEAALVGGTKIFLHPQSAIHLGRIVKACPDGKTKSFSENADGCVGSEAINVLFLQKAKHALRIHAEVVYVKSEFLGLLDENTISKYGFYRNPTVMANYIKKFYEAAKVLPQSVEYVEAHGSAVPEADKAELEVIDEVFCSQRDRPLLVGSVMSNIGYCEAASGIAAITKVLLGYHNGTIAANLHCDQPRQDVSALREGRMRVVTEHQPFDRTYVAVNGMSVTGVNSHVLLHGRYKPKDLSLYKCSIPYLVTLSSRSEEMVQNVIDKIKSRPIDPEELALLHNIHKTSIQGHLGRGFVILNSTEDQKTLSVREKAEYFDSVRRPLWFVYSGMGSQWVGMGTQLMRIPIFAAAIERCRQALEPKGIDIIQIITSTDKNIYDNILHSFVGIAAVQIGLTDILREVGILPDGIIGHSVGELGCAYADGCLTAEEMILSAYSRGLVSLQTPFIRGSMAAVGLGYEKILEMCPEEIQVACHNGPESCTISGPADVMKQFVDELKGKGIFAKEVPCSNIAYHSRYIADAGPGLLKKLSEVIKNPRPRSQRWLSTSVPRESWDEPLAKYSSAEYHTNNLLSPVLFEETARLIPSNAVLVEVAPHGLLQAILKRSLPTTCSNIALTKRGQSDNVVLVLEAIGKLYVEGYNPKVHVLYPKIDFPVSTETPLLSHLVEWVHTESWFLPYYSTALIKKAAVCKYVISLYDEEHKYLRGNVVRGQTLYPFSAALVAAWDTLAMTMGVPRKKFSVEFKDVKLLMQPVLLKSRQMRLSVSLQIGNGYFEILDENVKVLTGFMTASETSKVAPITVASNDDWDLASEDIYCLLEDRDYSYSGDFRSIVRANSSLNNAEILWRDNWVTLLDGILQLNGLRQAHNGVSIPTNIRSISIDIDKHNMCNNGCECDGNILFNFEILENYDMIRCAGVVIENIKYFNLPAVTDNKIDVKSLQFVPRFHFDSDITTSLQVHLQIVAENVSKDIINVVGITAEQGNGTLLGDVQDIFNELTKLKVRYQEVNTDIITRASNDENLLKDIDLVITVNLFSNKKLSSLLEQMLQRDRFIINEEDVHKTRTYSYKNESNLYHVLSRHTIDSSRQLNLVRWKPTQNTTDIKAVSLHTQADFESLKSARAELSGTPEKQFVVITPYPSLPGLKEFIGDWRKDIKYNSVSLIVVNDHKLYDHKFKPKFQDLDLAFNVVNHGQIGGQYYVPIQVDVSNDKNKNVTLHCGRICNFESLSWVEAPEPIIDGLTVKVHYAGINYGDIKKVSGTSLFKEVIDNNYGMDFSGITNNGQRVMGIVPSGACTSRVRAIPELMWPVPGHWSLEDAATVPLAYAYAFYCLGVKSQLMPGKSVLVHGGTGALGQAVISVALANGCEVFTTVSNVQKKQFLQKLFPRLKGDHIGNSRDESFADMVISLAKNRGCDVVINTGAENVKDVTLKCCSLFAIYFDITQLHNNDDYIFGMGHLDKDVNYVAVDLSSIFMKTNYEETKAIQIMISEGITRGYVRPISRVSYATCDVARAFRLVAASRHRGRVLLRMKDGISSISPRWTCDLNLSQVVICNDKLVSLQLVDKLVESGARKLFLHCNPKLSALLQVKKRLWETRGVQVSVSTSDWKTEKDIISTLNCASNLGSIEGIYVMLDEEKGNNEDVYTSLDIISRKLCPKLRNFVIINEKNDTGKYTCLTRVESKLPATFLSITAPKDKSPYNIVQWHRSVAEIIQRAVSYKAGALLAQPLGMYSSMLLQKIVNITGIKISEATPLNTTLEELGIEQYMLKLISNLLKIDHNAAFTEDEIYKLTIKSIQQIDEMDGCLQEDVTGLGNFFSYVDADELLATTDIVFLPTLVSQACMRDDEMDTSLKYFCIIPGLEGHHERFRVLCERLKLPAIVLQPGLDSPDETLRDLALRYVEILLNKIELKNNFYLLGYESGVLIALEVASILEERGMTGTIFCLGFMQDEFKDELERHLYEFKTEDQLQDALVRHMFKLMVNDDTVELETALQRASTWTEKVDVTVRNLLGRVPHSAQYARSHIESALARIEQTRRYNWSAQPLRSRVILLRAATATTKDEQDLQSYSQQPVVSYQLNMPLAHAATDMQCAALVNKHFDPEILEAFNITNICDDYLLNADCFVRTTLI